MAANFKVFVDGNRLPAEEINNFLAKQCVVQVDGQNDLAPLTEYGVRMAMTLDTGALWFYTDLGGWSPLEIDGLLTLDEADERYLTQLTAEGLFLTKTEGADFLTGDEIATTYLAKLTAEGLYLSQTDAELNYLGKTEASTTYVSNLTAQQLYLSKTDASNTYETIVNAGSIYLSKTDASNTYLSQNSASSTYLTQIDAGSIYLSKTDASGTYLTQLTANGLYISTSANVGDYLTSISGDKITSGTIQAVRFQTAPSGGKRVLLSESSNSIVFYNDYGSLVGRVQGSTADSGSLLLNGPGSPYLRISSASTQVGGNLSASGTITAGTTLGAVNFASTYYRDVGRTNDGTGGRICDVTSDERAKTNIVDMAPTLDIINQLRPVIYNWKENPDGEKFTGLIAQEVNEVIDQSWNVVFTQDIPAEGETEPYMGINYSQFTGILIKAVQELSAKNDELEARLAALEGGNG